MMNERESVEELKNNFCFEDFKQEVLNDYLKKTLDRYVNMKNRNRLLNLVEIIGIRCATYFQNSISTYDIWSLDSGDDERSIHLEYNLYTLRNNHLRFKNYILAFLEEENGIFTFEYDELNNTVCNEKEEKQLNHDMEVGRFMLQCCADLLNDLLQGVEK